MAERRNLHKQYVKVRADHEIGGRVVPLMFRAEDGEAQHIDKIVFVCEAPSLKAGGQGTRYTCRIGGCELYLFHDRDDWFIEVG